MVEKTKRKEPKVYRTYTIEKDNIEKAEKIARENGFCMSAVVNLLIKYWIRKFKI